MGAAVTAADANRNFSALLGQVKGGRTVTITSHGRAVARMVPVGAGSGVTSAARTALFDRLRTAPVQDLGGWTRDELYEDS